MFVHVFSFCGLSGLSTLSKKPVFHSRKQRKATYLTLNHLVQLCLILHCQSLRNKNSTWFQEKTRPQRARGTMEKVWDELKKIETQAEGIRAEAQKLATQINDFARQQAEKLIANSKTYAEEDAQQLYSREVEGANHKREELLKANRETANELKARAEKQVERAASAVEAAVLGETKS